MRATAQFEVAGGRAVMLNPALFGIAARAPELPRNTDYEAARLTSGLTADRPQSREALKRIGDLDAAARLAVSYDRCELNDTSVNHEASI
jgi:hypothetical protein